MVFFVEMHGQALVRRVVCYVNINVIRTTQLISVRCVLYLADYTALGDCNDNDKGVSDLTKGLKNSLKS